jgi:hypothetical protein
MDVVVDMNNCNEKNHQLSVLLLSCEVTVLDKSGVYVGWGGW